MTSDLNDRDFEPLTPVSFTAPASSVESLGIIN